MEDVSRRKLNEEFERICDRAKELQPGSTEHENLISELCDLGKLQNADDELIAKRDNEKYDRGTESEKNELERKKLILEEEKLERDVKRRNVESYVAIGVALISAISSVAITVYKANKNSEWQEKSFDFESNYSYTSKGSKLFDFAR